MCVDVYYNLNLVECTRDPLVLSSVPHTPSDLTDLLSGLVRIISQSSTGVTYFTSQVKLLLLLLLSFVAKLRRINHLT